MNVIADLKNIFGDTRAPSHDAEWRKLCHDLAEGTLVKGVIVLAYPFGVFVDIGSGFAALLEVIRMRQDQERSVGSEVSARVVAHNDHSRQIGLSQLDPDPFLKSKLGAD